MDGFIPLLVETSLVETVVGVMDIFGAILGNGDFVGERIILGEWDFALLGDSLGLLD